MADNFFGFDTAFPSKNVLGSKGLEEELLTADVEEEFDALNDETFGKANDDDWEEAHEKLTKFITKDDYGELHPFEDSLLENDDSQNEIVSKSISQLGLEDDLDDPAIMSVSRNCYPIRQIYGSSSPPPPAILETELCGSPKTHSIWSTTPKDSGLASYMHSIHNSTNSQSHIEPTTPVNSPSDNVFTTPRTWRAEELEKDLLSTPLKWANKQEAPAQVSISTQNAVSPQKIMTGEEVERQILSDPRLRLPPPGMAQFVPPPPMMNPLMPPPIMPIRHNQPMSMEQLAHFRRPMLANGAVHPYMINPRMNNMMHNQLPLRGPQPNLPPGFNPPNMNLNHKLLSFPPRSINHPFLHKQFQFPMLIHNSHYNGDEMHTFHPSMEDEYAGLMTQYEKDWLLKIQINQLKFDNPYVEDYYFVTQVAKNVQKKYSESTTKNSSEAPEIILPQTTKPENHAYVPIQFAGSLGKLQAVSVNFPRKVLDIKVTRPQEDDDGKALTNLCLMRYRRLLLDIESLYLATLEIEDEERRILAKPVSEGGPHRENILRLKGEMYESLFTKSEEQFANVMSVRKGRNLVVRAFKMFSKDQQLQCLVSIFQNISTVLKNDQNDLVLLKYVELFTSFIQTLTFSEMIKVVATLENKFFKVGKTKQLSSFAVILSNRFGSSVICSMLMRGEKLYFEFHKQSAETKEKWTKFIVTLSEFLCGSQTSSLSPSVISITDPSAHFGRFVPDKEKFSVLKEKLSYLIPQVSSTNEPAVEKTIRYQNNKPVEVN